jgi:hypothetical protein
VPPPIVVLPPRVIVAAVAAPPVIFAPPAFALVIAPPALAFVHVGPAFFASGFIAGRVVAVREAIGVREGLAVVRSGRIATGAVERHAAIRSRFAERGRGAIGRHWQAARRDRGFVGRRADWRGADGWREARQGGGWRRAWR